MIEEPLENLHKQLNIILDEVNRSAMTDFGLVINKPEKNENKRSSHSYKKLPIPKRKKSSLTGRVGAANEARRRAQVINVKSETLKKNKLIEEIVNINKNMHCDIPLSSEKELPIEESSEISDTKKLASMNNNQLAKTSAEKTNNGEDHSINIQKSLNLKTSNVLPFLTTKPPNTCLSETALQNDCYTVIFLDLMSLEVCHAYAQMKDKII